MNPYLPPCLLDVEGEPEPDETDVLILTGDSGGWGRLEAVDDDATA